VSRGGTVSAVSVCPPVQQRITASDDVAAVTAVNCDRLLVRQPTFIQRVQPSNRRGNRAEALMPPCAFKMSMLNVSAIRIKSRS
jgi:hypothetical protein